MTYSQYWKGASTFYPVLARIVRDYGTILSTSVPSKSVFSIAGLQITKSVGITSSRAYSAYGSAVRLRTAREALYSP
jgi:hypothetical protein